MAFFDPVSQRRTENTDRAEILPAAETLPALMRGGAAALAAELERQLKGVSRRKTDTAALYARTLRERTRSCCKTAPSCARRTATRRSSTAGCTPRSTTYRRAR